jgi:hydrogenase nickel incorporation protein HypA/HybF
MQRKSIVELATAEAERHTGARVEAVHLKLGALSGVVKDALLFSWDRACQDTTIAGCRLAIEDAGGRELEVTALELEDG